MLKMVVSVVLSGFVLSSGLVSCAPDGNKNVVKDVYKPAMPKVRHASGGFLDLAKGVMLTSADIRDIFDFSDAAPAKIRVLSECNDVSLKSEFVGKQKLQVFQLIHWSLTTRDLKNEVVKCTFEINIYNKAGSDLALKYKYVQLTDLGESQITIEKGGRGQSAFNVLQLDDVNIRYNKEGRLDANLNCQDIKFESAVFESKLMPFSSINFARPIPQDTTAPYAYKRRGQQQCRLWISKEEDVLEISSLFSIQFPLAPITASIVPSGHDSSIPTKLNGMTIMYYVRFTNAEPTPRTIRYVTRRYDVQSQVYTNGRFIVSLPVSQPTYLLLVDDWREADGRLVEFTVPAKGEYDVPVAFAYNTQLRCIRETQGHTLHVVGSLDFNPISPEGQPETPIVIGNLPTVWGYLRPGTNPAAYQPGPNVVDPGGMGPKMPNCGWY